MRRLILVLALLGAAGTARAQTLEDRLRSQLVSVTNQLRQLQASQAGLQADKAAAEKARDDLKARLASAEAQLHTARRAPPPAPQAPPAELQRAQADVQRLAEDNAKAQAEISTLQVENQRLAETANQMRAEHDRLTTASAAAAQSLEACKAKNGQAIAVAKDILAAFDREGVVGALARKEPFTRLKRVQIEQLEQDYADRLYDSRLDARPRKAEPAAGAKTQ